MVNTHPMYVCDRCTWGQYHPMNYCPKCPGQLHRQEVPHPLHRFKDESDRIKCLAEVGVTYTEEYPALDPKIKTEFFLKRYEEKVEDLKKIAAEETDPEKKKKADDSVAYWARCLERHTSEYKAKYKL